MDIVKKFVQECLPAISSEENNLIMERISALGVECFDDLQLMEPEKDLNNIINVIQARKLKKKIEAAFNQDKMVIQPQLVEVIQPTTSSINHEEMSIVELVPKHVANSESLEASSSWNQFTKVPIERFSKKLRSKLERGERPLPTERRDAVRIIAAAVMEHIPVPRKKHLETVAMEVVRQFPDSFKDSIGNNSIGFGHSSLLCQLIARVENCRRTAGAVKAKVSSARKAPKKFADSYGCMNHQPSDFPDGEDEGSQKEKQLFLKNEFSKVHRDYSKITEYMFKTYASQRMTINTKSSIKNIKSEWPFLIERQFLFQHAEHLIGFSLRSTFEGAIKEKLGDLMNYATSVDKKYEQLNPPKIHLLQILCSLFNEDLELLIKVYEEDKSLVDVCEEAPVTPFIACIGNPFELAPACTVFVEKEPFETNIPLDDALLMWFSSFYVFNLVYPKECCATLEFIQRALFGINPQSKGSKMEKRFGKRVDIHPKVLKLINNIKDFSSKWKI